MSRRAVLPFVIQIYIVTNPNKGYHVTTTRGIARLAGSSPVGRHTYRSTKTDYLCEISLITLRCVVDIMVKGLDAGTVSGIRMSGLVEGSVTYHAKDHVVTRAVNADFRTRDEPRATVIRWLRRRAKRMVVAEISYGADSVVFVVSNVAGASIAVLCLMDASSWYTARGRMFPTVLAEVYSTLVLQMLGVQE